MKKFILAIACLSVVATGCKKKAKELADVNVDIPYSEVTGIPNFGLPPGFPIPNGGLSLDLPPYSIPTFLDDYLKLYNTTPDKVNSITMKALGVRMTSPVGAGANFNFMDSLAMYISVNGQPEILAGWRYDIPQNVDTFALNVTSANLKSYFLEDSVHVRLKGHVTAVPPNDDSVRSTVLCHLFANPLN